MAVIPLLSGGVPDTERRAVVAQPVGGNFHQVQPDSRLMQLAAALQGLSRPVAQLGATLQERQNDRDRTAGEQWAAALDTSKEENARAIREGKIAPAQSAWFRYAAARKLGQVSGAKFNGLLLERLKDLGETASLDDFESAASQARADWLETEAGASAGNLSFLTGFSAEGDNAIANARRAFVAQQDAKLERNAAAAFGQVQYRVLEDAYNAGVDVGTLAAQVNASADQWDEVNPLARKGGRLGEGSINELNAQAIVDLAIQKKDASILEAARHVRAGTGTLWDTNTFREKMRGVEDAILNANRAADNREREEQDTRQREVATEIQGEAYAAYLAGQPINKVALADRLREAGVKNAEYEVDRMVINFPEMHGVSMANYREMIFHGRMPSVSAMKADLAANKLSQGQFNMLMNDAEAMQARARAAAEVNIDPERLFNSEYMAIARRTVDALTKSKLAKDPLFGTTTFDGAPFQEADVQAADTWARTQLQDYMLREARAGRRPSEDQLLNMATGLAYKAALDNGILTPEEYMQRRPQTPAERRNAALHIPTTQQQGPAAASVPKSGQSTGARLPGVTAAELSEFRDAILNGRRLTRRQRELGDMLGGAKTVPATMAAIEAALEAYK